MSNNKPSDPNGNAKRSTNNWRKTLSRRMAARLNKYRKTGKFPKVN